MRRAGREHASVPRGAAVDCVAEYRQDLHEASLKNLANIGRVITSEEFLKTLGMPA